MTEILGVMICTSLLVMSMLLGAFYWNKNVCRSQAEVMGFHWQHTVLTGCMIHVDGQWVPKDRYRVVED